MLIICKVLVLNELKQITVLGMGILGGSLTLAIKQRFPNVKAVGYSHRESTREKARGMNVADEILDDQCESVAEADMVILATPIRTFEGIFKEISGALKPGCIVTDVGSTKAKIGEWAAEMLPDNVRYVGSHPIAGSEKNGVEFSRDDLFYEALCIVTKTEQTNEKAFKTVREFWEAIGCSVLELNSSDHDRIFANVSHIPHMVAAALINSTDFEEMKFAGRGFLDTSRIASGPANIWTDIVMTNSQNISAGIDEVIGKLGELKDAIAGRDNERIMKLLDAARNKRNELIKFKLEQKELI